MPIDILIPNSTVKLSSIRLAQQIHLALRQTQNILNINPLPNQMAKDEFTKLNVQAIAMDATHELEMEKLETEMFKQDYIEWWS